MAIPTESVTVPSGFDEFSVSPSHPLYLHPSINPGTHLVTLLFDGTGFIVWKCLSKFAELAYHCLREQGVQRPSMGDIVKTLEFALQLQEGADNRRHHDVEGCILPVGPSFTLTMYGHANTTEIFSDLSEVDKKLTSNGISMSISRSAKLKNVTIFSEIVNPLGR
ncbi:hypothetical protein BC332_05823 [Capsicum chinense]|nr:hypothetical protein BC332_05823 [Capsicum chinense]